MEWKLLLVMAVLEVEVLMLIGTLPKLVKNDSGDGYSRMSGVWRWG